MASHRNKRKSIVKRKEKVEQTAYVTHQHRAENAKLAKVDADIYYLESWYARASWKKKMSFMMQLIRNIQDEDVIKMIVRALQPLTKDFYYAKGQVNKYSYDQVPNDDDRCLDESTLAKLMELETKWVNTLQDSRKLSVILDLLKMSGSEITKLALNEAKSLSDILEFITFLEDRFLKPDVFDSKFKKATGLTSVLIKRLHKDPNFTPLQDEYKLASSLTPVEDKQSMNAVLKVLANKKGEWDRQLQKLIRTVKLGGGGKQKLPETSSEPDLLQYLPVWINKQIIGYLDEESRANLAEVDRYWNYTVQEKENEEEIRRILDGVVNKMDLELMKAKLPGMRYSAVLKKNKKTKGVRKSKSLTNLKKMRASSKKKKSPSSIDLGFLLDEQPDFKESILGLVKFLPSNRIPFNGLYNEMYVTKTYMYDRSIACSGKWVACSENTSVVLFNLITGAQSSFKLSGHNLVVTCLSFFPSSFRIASGSLDKTVKVWNIWTGKEIITLQGHTDVILTVSTNENYVVSCSRDCSIRVFALLKGGYCTKIIKPNEWVPTSAIISNTDIVYWSTREGALFMFSVTDDKIDRQIIFAHKGDITFICKFGPLIVSGALDQFVRIWNENFKRPKCLSAFQHSKKVNSAIISHLTLITACEDGVLRFWNIYTEELFRAILVNYAKSPIMSICAQICNDHVKIVCNNESNVYALEFRIPWFKKQLYQKKADARAAKNPFKEIWMYPLDRKAAELPRERRLRMLDLNKSTLPQFRNRNKYESFPKSRQCLLKNLLQDERDVSCVPRILSPKVSSLVEYESEEEIP